MMEKESYPSRFVVALGAAFILAESRSIEYFRT